MKVTNIPTSEDFDRESHSAFNLAFDTFTRFISDHSYVIEWAGDETPETLEHIESSKYLIRNIINLLFLSVEFQLKSILCATSPFLLLDGPKSWPKPKSGTVSFGSLRSISASDLQRAIELFGNKELSEGAWKHFEKLRAFRNESSHSISGAEYSLESMFIHILRVSEYFLGSKNPFPIRIKFLDSADGIYVYPDHLRNQALAEFELLRKIFGSEFFKAEIGVPDKRLNYCGVCHWEGKDWDEQPKTAEFNGEQTYCYACGETDSVYEAHCALCEGVQAFSTKSDLCLNCGYKA